MFDYLGAAQAALALVSGGISLINQLKSGMTEGDRAKIDADLKAAVDALNLQQPDVDAALGAAAKG
jgi:hypothetical protein